MTAPPAAEARSPEAASRIPNAGSEETLTGHGGLIRERRKAEPFRAISAAEWRWLAVMTLLIVGLTLIPPTLARLYGPQDRVHLGTYWYPQDFTQYLATMREAGSSPSWLVHDHSSAEPHDPVFMFPLYAATGKLAAATSLDSLAIYAAVEMAARVILPITLYVFAASMIGTIAGRRLAFVLAAFSSGLGFWVALGQNLFGVVAGSGEERPGASAYVVEVVTFGNFLAAPHLGFGLAGTLGALVLFTLASRGSQLALAGLVLDIVALGLTNPFNLPVLLLAFGLQSVWCSLTARHLVIRPFAATALAAAAALPMLLYNLVTFSFTPFWSVVYGSDNRLASPGPWNLPIDFGVVFLLAPLGILTLLRSRTPEHSLLLMWLTLSMIGMYLPVAYQRRFAFGLQPGLAVIAALGWPMFKEAVLRGVIRLGARPSLAAGLTKRLTRYGFAALAFPTTTMALLLITISAVANEPVDYYMVDRDTYALGQWLAEHSGSQDVVAGSLNTGNVFSGLIPGRVVARWEKNHATLHGVRKSAMIAAMYRGESSRDEIVAFLDANRATYLIVGPEERKVGAYDPGAELLLPVAKQIGEATAYQVRPEPMARVPGS